MHPFDLTEHLGERLDDGMVRVEVLALHDLDRPTLLEDLAGERVAGLVVDGRAGDVLLETTDERLDSNDHCHVGLLD
jgi:hypothetical protein